MTDRQCGGAVCDRGRCVDCVDSADCPASSTCFDNTCVEQPVGCRSVDDCGRYGLICDPTTDECVECLDASHCAGGAACLRGRCSRADAGVDTRCGAANEPCCAGGVCGGGLSCQGGTCVRSVACGGLTQPCCAGGTCAGDLSCEAGHCTRAPTCGGLDEPCCDGSACADGLACQDSVCRVAACGERSEPCCAGGTCNGDLRCVDGSCQSTSTSCNPVTNAGCRADEACRIEGEAAVCRAAGTAGEGDACEESDSDCRAGLVCLLSPVLDPPWSCRRYCRVGGTDCSPSATCAMLASTPVIVDGVEYGACSL